MSNNIEFHYIIAVLYSDDMMKLNVTTVYSIS